METKIINSTSNKIVVLLNKSIYPHTRYTSFDLGPKEEHIIDPADIQYEGTVQLKAGNIVSIVPTGGDLYIYDNFISLNHMIIPLTSTSAPMVNRNMIFILIFLLGASLVVYGLYKKK